MRDDEPNKLYSELSPQQPSAPNIYGTIGTAPTQTNTAPTLPTAKEVSKRIANEPQLGQNFRLQKINEIKLYLESERDSRRVIARKYK